MRFISAAASSNAYLLIVLTLVGAVNWADRQVVPILFPALRRELALSDTELGIIGGLAFSLVYALSGLVFGFAADRYPRKYLIAGGLVVWSIATAAGGLATGFGTLFWARFFTGVGEASLYPCALSLIGERFPAERRGRALGIFAAAPAIGGGLGVGLGGRLSELVGFRQVFFWYGAVGLVLCLPLLFSLHEPARGSSAQRERPDLELRATLGDRRLLLIWLAEMVAMAAGQGFAAWGPSFFVRNAGLDVSQAGALFGLSALFGGVAGGLLGGAAADRRRKVRAGGELDVAAVMATLGALLIAVTLVAPPALASGAGLLATLSIYALFPCLIAALLGLVPPHRHGLVGALNALFIGGIGAAAGPFAVGALSDATGDLQLALAMPVVSFAVAAALAILAGRTVRDQQRQSAALKPGVASI